MPESSQKTASAILKEVKQEIENTQRPWYYMGRVARLLFSFYAVLLVLFASLAWWAHANPVNPLDVAITLEFQEHLPFWLRLIMEIISYPGSSFVLPLLVLLSTVAFAFVGLRLEAVIIPVHSVMSALLNAGLKLLVGRPRPNVQLVEVFQSAKGLSFPSGHVMAYLAFWGLIFSLTILLFQGWRWWRIFLLSVAGLFLLLVGPSRIILGDHWASDVLGSYLIGGALLGVTLWIYLRLKRRGVFEIKQA